MEIQQGLNRLDLWRQYLRSDLDMARRRLNDQEKRLADWKPAYGDQSLGQSQWRAYARQETILRPAIAETDNLDAAVRSLQELVLWRHDRSTFNERPHGLYVNSRELASNFQFEN